MSGILHTIGQAIRVPCLIVLLCLILVTVWQIGDVLVEALMERRKRCRDVPNLLRKIHEVGSDGILGLISSHAFLKSQRNALIMLAESRGMSRGERNALAQTLLDQEEAQYKKTIAITDIAAKLGPMFGLLGTLIPLGPGIVALGMGNTELLSQSLSVAFDTTIAGVISAAVCSVISHVRKRWYDEYLSGMECVMECILEEVAPE